MAHRNASRGRSFCPPPLRLPRPLPSCPHATNATESPPLPLACIFGMSHVPPVFNLHFPLVSHRIPSWYPALYPCIYLHLAVLQQIHCILLYLTVSSCIRTHLAASCIQLFPTVTVSHRIPPTRKRDIDITTKIHSRGGLLTRVQTACTRACAGATESLHLHTYTYIRMRMAYGV